MGEENKKPIVYVVSDSVGETAEFVVRAAVIQFNGSGVEIRRVPFVDDVETLHEVILSAKETNGIIAFTLIIPKLREYILEKGQEIGVTMVDIMGPMMEAFNNIFTTKPKLEAGLVHRLDEEYFKKVEAIEFAVKYDDGKDARGILRADVVLIGVSRTSKTPLSMYLAHKRIKAANVPLVPEVAPPEELFSISPNRCIGLMIDPEQLYTIRSERLKTLGLTPQASYANMERIEAELNYAKSIMEKIGCPVINVTNKAVEETANLIIEQIRQHNL